MRGTSILFLVRELLLLLYLIFQKKPVVLYKNTKTKKPIKLPNRTITDKPLKRILRILFVKWKHIQEKKVHLNIELIFIFKQTKN